MYREYALNLKNILIHDHFIDRVTTVSMSMLPDALWKFVLDLESETGE